MPTPDEVADAKRLAYGWSPGAVKDTRDRDNAQRRKTVTIKMRHKRARLRVR